MSEIDIDKIHAWQEIERLKAKIKVLNERLVIPGLHMQSLMDVEHQRLAEKEAEIKALLLKHEKEKNILLVALESLTKEIERLKAESQGV